MTGSRRARPDDAIVGEEFGAVGRRCASLDRRPDRRHEGLRARDPGLGDADRARARRRACGRRGVGAGARIAVVGGARVRARSATATPIRVSKVARHRGRPPRVRLGAGVRARTGIGEAFLALARRCWRTRGFGDFWAHVLVADGSIDIAVEVGGLAVWDLAAPMVVVEEAGGRSPTSRRRARRRRQRRRDERTAARRRVGDRLRATALSRGARSRSASTSARRR